MIKIPLPRRYEDTQAIMKGWKKIGLFVNAGLVNFPAPGSESCFASQDGSGSGYRRAKSMRIPIHNTAFSTIQTQHNRANFCG
jgi:hypothetical protein